MTVQEILDELGDHGFSNTISTARKLAFINDAVWDIYSRDAWPFLTTTLNLTFDGSSATPSNWPADFKAVRDIINRTTGDVIIPERVDTIDKRLPTNLSDVGTPAYYYFVGTTAKFYPIPPASTTLQMRYLRQQTKLVQADVEAAILMPPQHHRAIVLGSLWKCYALEDDLEMSNYYKIDFENRMTSMRRDLFMLQYDRPDRVHVIGYDDVEDLYL